MREPTHSAASHLPDSDTGITVQHAPSFSAAEAVRLARELFGVECAAEPLPSERDQNFLLRTAGGEQFVLKIANAEEQREILDFQNLALRQLEGKLGECQVQRVLPTLKGELIASVVAPDGRRHDVRLCTYVPGVCLATVKPHSPELLADLGATVARLDLALRDFSHPAMHRAFHWDLKRAVEARRWVPRIADAARRTLVERTLNRFERDVLPRLEQLSAQVIHNDANDYNALVALREGADLRVSGLLDFGDMVHAPAVCDAAVAATYALLGKPNAVAAAAHVVRGYHTVRPLEEREVALLPDLICARLCLSVTLSAVQSGQAPSNDYLRISEQQAWEALERLEARPPDWAHCVFREACALPPCPHSQRVVEWLRANQKQFAPVVAPEVKRAKVQVFDLSAGSLELPSGLDPADADAFTAFIFDAMHAAGAEIGVGRYNEPRLCYRARQFEVQGNDGPEWRTVHLGIDLFLPPGSPVYAPLAGTVHSSQDNNFPLDYGPTVLLQHDAGGVPFFTLYCHLSRSSLSNLREGMPVHRGQQIGTIGTASENGGWAPHLHFQIITDLFGERGNYPGVAAPSQRTVWTGICPDPNLILQIPAECLPASPMGREEILAVRRAHVGRSLSLTYRRPLHIVRGYRQNLYDAEGRVYLDAVNNVPHVGYCHPRVVRASQQQMAVLNTNTRYLYAPMAEYVERLVALLPEPLCVCFFVSSGSEANELALRLARAYTRRRDIVVVEGGYHGNTTTLVEVSHYKFAGPGGDGPAPYVHVAPLPDTFRGPYRGEDASMRYAQHVAEILAEADAEGRPIGAFLMESLPSSAGMVVPPAGYLREVYRHIRAAGGVTIADEVQVGFGRTGKHFWGFQTQEVVPDIVTLGKPIGNGHPLAAVITTREIADAFATGMEYFSTFGGNPVSCAVGLAVLDVLRDERLQENALVVGERLLDGLRRLRQKHEIIGDVRWMGLFLGIELVRDRTTLEPAAAVAAYVAERMKDRGILIGTEGPRHNVLKIRPPMCFTAADADSLLATLDSVLEEKPARMAASG